MSGFDPMSLLPFVLLFGVFYFLILRPQQQKMKKHQNMLSNLRRGDRVVTSGGLIGTISKIVNEGEVQIELADDIRVRHVRSMITDVLAKTDPATTNDGSSTPPQSSTASPVARAIDAKKAKGNAKSKVSRSTGKTKK